MRKKHAVYLVLLLVFTFVAGCSDDDAGLPEYYMAFKIDGQARVFGASFGEAEFGNKPFGCYITDDDETFLFAQPVQTYYSNSAPTNYLMIGINGSGTGTYTGLVGEFDYIENGQTYNDHSFSLTITGYDAAGGVIEGTFFASVSNDGEPLRQITDGSFRLLRLADNTFD